MDLLFVGFDFFLDFFRQVLCSKLERNRKKRTNFSFEREKFHRFQIRFEKILSSFSIGGFKFLVYI